MKTIFERLSKIKPLCEEAKLWLGVRTNIAQAWAECPRGDWLLWVAGAVELDRALIVRSACAAARTALPAAPEGELRPLRAIEAAEAWANDQTKANARAAATYAAATYATYADATYADATYADATYADATYAAAFATYAAYSAACAACAAYSAAAAVVGSHTSYATSAAYAAYAAARVAGDKVVADAVRSVITADGILAAFARLGI